MSVKKHNNLPCGSPNRTFENTQPSHSARFPSLQYKEFSGAGEQQLRQFTKMSVDKADRENVELTFESMMEFYAVNDPMKAEEDVEAVLKRCAGQAKAGGKCAGGAAGELARKLKKKYGKGPKTAKRFQPSEKEEEKEKKVSSSEERTTSWKGAFTGNFERRGAR